MSIIATAVKHLMAAGVTGDALIAAIADMEANASPIIDAVAERRRAYDRKRKRINRNSTGHPPESAEIAEVTPSLSPPNENNLTPPIPTPDNTTRARGARLSSDWEPNPNYPPTISKMLSLWPDDRMKIELDAFRDYWTSRSRDAAKLNWDKTWHNRIRDQHDRILKNGTANWTNNLNGSEVGLGATEIAVKRAIEDHQRLSGSFGQDETSQLRTVYDSNGADPRPNRAIGHVG